MAYPTTAELVSQSGVSELASLSAPRQDALRASTLSAIEGYVGQTFDAYDGELEVEAEGGRELWLPRRLRVLRSVVPYLDDPIDSSALMVSSGGNKLIFRKNVVGVGYYSQALYEISGGDYRTSFPVGQLLIDGEWGWTDVPQGVIDAIRMDMEDQALADANALTPTVNVARKLGLTGVRQGNLDVTLGAIATFTPRVERALDPFIFYGRGGHLV